MALKYYISSIQYKFNFLEYAYINSKDLKTDDHLRGKRNADLKELDEVPLPLDEIEAEWMADAGDARTFNFNNTMIGDINPMYGVGISLIAFLFYLVGTGGFLTGGPTTNPTFDASPDVFVSPDVLNPSNGGQACIAAAVPCPGEPGGGLCPCDSNNPSVAEAETLLPPGTTSVAVFPRNPNQQFPALSVIFRENIRFEKCLYFNLNLFRNIF